MTTSRITSRIKKKSINRLFKSCWSCRRCSRISSEIWHFTSTTMFKFSLTFPLWLGSSYHSCAVWLIFNFCIKILNLIFNFIQQQIVINSFKSRLVRNDDKKKQHQYTFSNSIPTICIDHDCFPFIFPS